MNFIVTLIIFALVLSLIIFIHEFGHFIAAKNSGVYVDEFSLGMGPIIYQFKPKKSETTYSLRALPIGGFVSMAEKYDKNNKIKKDRVLENKGFLRNLWVFINGILFNFILAIILFFISGLIYGRPVNEAIINSVTEGEAAYKAGLQAGDKILEIDGNKINTLDDFILEVSAKKFRDKYTFEVLKENGKVETYEVTPRLVKEEETEKRVFGMTMSAGTYKKGFVEAIKYGFVGFYDNFTTIFKILGSLITGEVGADNLSGPVGIYSVIDTAKSQGLETIIYLTAYLSINVGIINLIPIPVFDGGRILILFIEKLTKKKCNEKAEMIINFVGFGLMILLMIYVTFNDIIRLVVN